MPKKKRQASGGKGSGKAAPRNETAATTIAALTAGKLSPTHRGADAAVRRRIRAAIETPPERIDRAAVPARGGARGGGPALILFDGTSFEAAAYAELWLRDRGLAPAPCVLDFASDSNAGGGWRGRQRGTQEEALCRASSLGLALERCPGAFGIPADGALYVRDVAVVRCDRSGAWRDADAAGDSRDPGRVFWCAAVAAALRECGGEGDRRLDAKVGGVAAAAVEAGHAALVGGAWGCGAFGNDAAAVAAAWGRAARGPAGAGLDLLVLALPRGAARAEFARALPEAAAAAAGDDPRDAFADRDAAPV